MTTIRLDPDKLYQEGSQTFFYVKGKLYVASYPETHKDMVSTDPELFEDIWGFPIEDAESKHFSRGVMVTQTEAHLGRVGIHSTTGPNIVVAFWKPVPDGELGRFFEALFRKYPMFESHKANILVVRGVPDYGGDGKVVEFSKVFGGEPAPKHVQYSAPKELRRGSDNPYDKKYDIGGEQYSKADLHRFRAGLHVNDRSGLHVLCHPDLANYPELDGYRPVDCGGGKPSSPTTGPSAWRREGWKQGVPYVYSYGECTFRQWVEYQDIFHVERA